MTQITTGVNAIGSILIAIFAVLTLGLVTSVGSFGAVGFVFLLAIGAVVGAAFFALFQKS